MRINDIEQGAITYVTSEFTPKFDDWRKWGVPLMFKMYTPTLKKMYYDNIELLKNAKIVDENDNIHIDSLYREISNIAKTTGNIRCPIPMIGEVTFSAMDVDKIYNILKSMPGYVPDTPTTPPIQTTIPPSI